MYRLIAYLGVLGCIIIGGILGLFVSVIVLATLDVTINNTHVLIGIALGAFIGGALAVIHVCPYLRKLREKKLAKYLTSIPENAGNLIKAIIEQMQYRKKVRADVMAELIAHFEDALRECAADEEKQQKADELIEQFGDAKLLGVLLRRAKKRCRPLWRTIIARGFQTVGVLILCLIVYLVWFLTGKPNVTVDYVAELNKLVRPAADDGLNAAPLYDKAIKLIELCEKSSDDSFRLMLTKSHKDVTVEQKQLVEKWVTDNEEIFELVIAGTQKPYYWQKYNDRKAGVMGILLPHLSRFKSLVYPLRWRAQLQAEQGQYEDAFNDTKVCYRFGQHIRGSKIIIEQLVGIAIEAFAVRTIRDILSEYEADSATLAGLQKDFEGLIADEDFVISLEVEKLIMYDEAQRCFTEGRLGGHLYIPRAIALGGAGDGILAKMDNFVLVILSPQYWRGAAKALFLHPNKKQTTQAGERLYAWAETIMNQTPAQIHAQGIDVEKQVMEIIGENLLLEILCSALWRVNEINYQNEADVEATLTIIAILRYKLDKDYYPDSLDKLAESGYLKQIPMDPFSDGPLVYRRTEDGFTLYSVGLNFIDDGGKVGKDRKDKPRLWADDGDAVFWPIQSD